MAAVADRPVASLVPSGALALVGMRSACSEERAPPTSPGGEAGGDDDHGHDCEHLATPDGPETGRAGADPREHGEAGQPDQGAEEVGEQVVDVARTVGPSGKPGKADLEDFERDRQCHAGSHQRALAASAPTMAARSRTAR